MNVVSEGQSSSQSRSGSLGNVHEALAAHREQMLAAIDRLKEQAPVLARIADLLVSTLRNSGKILLVGNGGSAAEAQHFSAELVGRFRRDTPPFAALALTTDSSILTAVANDYSYEDVFTRQVEALGRRDDVLVAFTTSGESPNLLYAARRARTLGIAVVAITGNRSSSLETLADLTVRAPSDHTPIVQEIHMSITHLLCGILEDSLSP